MRPGERPAAYMTQINGTSNTASCPMDWPALQRLTETQKSVLHVRYPADYIPHQHGALQAACTHVRQRRASAAGATIMPRPSSASHRTSMQRART